MAENNENQRSALLSIASAYSDSEESEEEETSGAGHSTLGGLVASLRTSQAGQQEEVKPIAEKVTKIVRLDSGKVVKIQVSPRSAKDGSEKEELVACDRGEDSPKEKPLSALSKEDVTVNLESKPVCAISCEEGTDVKSIVDNSIEDTNEMQKATIIEQENIGANALLKKSLESTLENSGATGEEVINTEIDVVSKALESHEVTAKEQLETKEKDIVDVPPEGDLEKIFKEKLNVPALKEIEEVEKSAEILQPISIDVDLDGESDKSQQMCTKNIFGEPSPEAKSLLIKTKSEKLSPLVIKTKLSPTLETVTKQTMSPKKSPQPADAASKDSAPPKKVLPPLPNLEKINLKSPEQKSGPAKCKRTLLGSPPAMMEAKKSKIESPSKPEGCTSEEIRELLSRRLGSGLDISILPSSSEKSEKSPTSTVKRSPELSSPPTEVKKFSPEVPVAFTDSPSITKQIPPQTAYQQRLALAQQSYQASFANLLRAPPLPISQPQRKVSPIKISPPKPDPSRQVVPGIVIRKMEGDGQRKVLPAAGARGAPTPEARTTSLLQTETREKLTMRVMAHASETGKGPLSMKITSQPDTKTEEVADGSSSSSDIHTSSSSQENSTSLPGADIDFEKIIGSSMLAKETGDVLPQPEPIPEVPTPRKRGRPRKTQQVPLVDPNPLVATWPPEGCDAFPTTGTPARSRRQRHETPPTFVLPKRRRRRVNKSEHGNAEGQGANETKREGSGDEDSKEGGDGDDSKMADDDSVRGEGDGDGGPKIVTPRKKKRRRGPFYVKRKPRVYDPNKKKEKENFQNFEEETRMSASEGSGTPLKSALGGDESLSNSVTTEGVRNTGNKKGRMEIVTEGIKPITVQQIVEYPWPPAALLPPGEKPENYMIQEQISEYLGVKSFKRKYPNVKRRAVDMEERNYLQENGYVTENMCDMGLTAVEVGDIMEIMFNDFPHKFDEYRKFSRERKAREQKALREKQAAERADMDPRQEALESASMWNAEFNKTRREKRSYYFDLQSFTVNVPRKEAVVDRGPIGYYPLALVSGQNTDYYKEYTPAELKYFPLNSILYGPMRPNEKNPHDTEGSDGSGSDSDDSSSSDDSSTSSSDDTQGSSSSECEEADPTFTVQSTPRIRPTSAVPTRARVRLAVKLDKIDVTSSPVILETIKESNEEPKQVKEAGPRKCKKCGGDEERNRDAVYERLISCSFCRKFWHPSCLSMSAAMVCRVESYKWQCSDCKACVRCNKTNGGKMISCGDCDRGHHLSCIGLQSAPTSKYTCSECTPPKPMDIEIKAEKLNEQLAMQVENKMDHQEAVA